MPTGPAAEFGPEAAEPIAAIFTRLDGRLPRPADWVDGPGSIKPDQRPWEQVRKEYAFVDELAALRPRIDGPGNLERFDYWFNNFRYLRSICRGALRLGPVQRGAGQGKAEKDPQARKKLARELALPVRKELVAAFAEMHRHLLATVTNPGEMGNVCNWQQQTLPVLLDRARPGVGQAAGRGLAGRRHAVERVRGPAAAVRARGPHRHHGRRDVQADGDRAGGEAASGRALLAAAGRRRVRRSAAGTRRPRRVHGHASGRGRQGRLRVLRSSRRPAAKSLVFPPTAPAMNQTVVVGSD